MAILASWKGPKESELCEVLHFSSFQGFSMPQMG